jgi:heptosyltransferase-2
MLSPAPPRSILVRAPNWLGDAVMATPAFRALRAGFPSAHLALHLRREHFDLFEGSPWFDELVSLRSTGERGASAITEGLALRERGFELGLCLPDSFSAALLMRAAGVRRIVGYGRGWRRALLHQLVSSPPATFGRLLIPRERHVLGLIEALGCEPRGTHLELFVTPRDEALAEARLTSAGVEAAAPLALLAPGASYGSSKLWPIASFARVGDALCEAGAAVALIGSAAERELCRELANRMRCRPHDLCGEFTLGALKGVLRRASVLVCNDAGARHVAAALGVPTVVVLGPTSLAKTNLNLERVRVLSADVGCRPCYHRVCPIDHRCMTRVEPALVIDAALPALRPGAAALFRGDGTLRTVASPADRPLGVRGSGP